VMRDSAEVLERFERLMENQAVRGAYTWRNTGVAATYVIAFRMLFIEEQGDALLLAQCLPEPWIESKSLLGIEDLPTYHGQVSYTLETEGRSSTLLMDASAAPLMGFHLAPVQPSVDPAVEIDGKLLKMDLNFKRRQYVPLPPGTLKVIVDW